jgi:hypothetical protein
MKTTEKKYHLKKMILKNRSLNNLNCQIPEGVGMVKQSGGYYVRSK